METFLLQVYFIPVVNNLQIATSNYKICPL